VLKFDPYVLFVLSFVQLLVATVLVLSPAREIGIRLRKGSRITGGPRDTVGAVTISAVACVLTKLLWGLPFSGLEAAAWPLVTASIVVDRPSPAERNT